VAAGPDGKCPTCARPLGSEFETVLASVAQQLEEVESSGKFFKQRVAQLAEEPDALREVEAKQAEASRRVREMVQQLAKAYPGKIRLVYKHYPLPSHADGKVGAEAANCVMKQKGVPAFWQFHGRVYQASDDLSEKALLAHAKAVGADPAESICYHGSMTLVPHFLGMIGRVVSARATVRYGCAERARTDRKQMAILLHREVLDLKMESASGKAVG